mmetsp:Transcript_3004/g.9355  ORF Transcript_3004/g.9355 Transcript_3004/m.9355 type:complete len:1358 (-) Transcript_3004:235-4308(-)
MSAARVSMCASLALVLTCLARCDAGVLVVGTGSSWPGDLYREAAYAFNARSANENNDRADYFDTNSVDGKVALVADLLDDEAEENEDVELEEAIAFAGADALTDGCTDDDPPECDEHLRFYPSVAGAVVPIFHLDFDEPVRNQTVVFSGAALAGIFSGKITRWNDPAIAELNEEDGTAYNQFINQYLEDDKIDKKIHVIVRCTDEEKESCLLPSYEVDFATKVFANALGEFDVDFLKFHIYHPNNVPTWCGRLTDSTVTVRKSLVGNHITCSDQDGDEQFSYTVVDSNEDLVAAVEAIENSIGYAEFNSIRLRDHSNPTTWFDNSPLRLGDMVNKAGRRVTVSTTAIEFAMMEQGGSFDESGIVSLVDAGGPSVWPITSYTYFVVREHVNIRCENRTALLEFMEFFYERASGTLASSNGFAPLPGFLRTLQFENMSATLLCEDNVLAAAGSDTSTVDGSLVVPLMGYHIMDTYRDSYIVAEDLEFAAWPLVSTGNSTDVVGVHEETQEVALALTSFDTADLVKAEYVGSDWPTAFYMSPLYVAAAAFIYRLDEIDQDKSLVDYRIILDIETLAKIYLGEITHWNDDAILALNEDIKDRLPPTEIRAVSRSDDSDEVVLAKRVLSSSNTDFGAEFGGEPGLFARLPDMDSESEMRRRMMWSTQNLTDESLIAGDSLHVSNLVRVVDGGIGIVEFEGDEGRDQDEDRERDEDRDRDQALSVARLKANNKVVSLSQESLESCVAGSSPLVFLVEEEPSREEELFGAKTYILDVWEEEESDGSDPQVDSSQMEDAEGYNVSRCWPLAATYDLSIKREIVQSICARDAKQTDESTDATNTDDEQSDVDTKAERRLVDFAHWILSGGDDGEVDAALTSRGYFPVPETVRADLTSILEAELKCSDEEPEPPSLEKVGLKPWVGSFTAVLCACVFALVCACVSWTWMYKERLIVRLSQPVYLMILCAGCVVSTSSVLSIFFGENKFSCQWQVYMYGMGFATTTGALVTKMYSMEKSIQSSLKFRATRPEQARRELCRDAARVMGVMAAGELTILLAWTFSPHPLEHSTQCTKKWDKIPNQDATCTRKESKCRSDLALHFLGALFCYHILCLGVGIFMCYRVRNIPSILAEGKWVFTAVYSQIQLLVLAFPLLLLGQSDYSAFTVIKTALICLCDITVLLMIFLPKIQMVWKYGDFDRDKIVQYISSTVHHSTQNDHIYQGLRKSEASDTCNSVHMHSQSDLCEPSVVKRAFLISGLGQSATTLNKCRSPSLINREEDDCRSSSIDDPEQTPSDEKAALFQLGYRREAGANNGHLSPQDDRGASPVLPPQVEPARLSNATIHVEREETKTPGSSLGSSGSIDAEKD